MKGGIPEAIHLEGIRGPDLNNWESILMREENRKKEGGKKKERKKETKRNERERYQKLSISRVSATRILQYNTYLIDRSP